MASTTVTDSKVHFAGVFSGAVSEKWTSLVKITHPKTSGIFPRKRLFRLIDKCREFPVIWVSAPAGSGKTTLVASYLDDRRLGSIWYRVDEGDGDIATFFYYMGLAARKGAPHAQQPLPLFTPEYLHGIPAFTLRYFEELYSRLTPPFVIVLDNYHHIQRSSQINEVISAGLEIIPEGINVILASREDPPAQFARLRVGDRISFLGKEEILFTADESKKMLQLKGFRDLGESMIRRLHERTLGWAAGLVLIMERARRRGFDDSVFSGSTPLEIFDYFTVEIFEKTDPETQKFLLKTVFLPSMTVSAAERLTGEVRSGEILSHLYGDQFFTEKSSEPDPGFRYHPLFRDFLLTRARKTFSRDDITLIQYKAACLLVEAGQMEDAANVLIEVGDWDGFIPVLLDYAPILTAQGRTKTLGEWLAYIPSNMIETSPWLLYWRGQCTFVVTPAEGRGYLEQAFQLFIEQNDDTGALMAWAGIADTFIYDFDYFKPLDKYIDWLDERVSRDDTFPSSAIEAAVASSMIGVLLWRRPGHPEICQWIERALSSSLTSGNSAVRLLALRRALLYYIWFGDQAGSLTVLGEIGKIVEAQSGPPYGLIAAKMLKAQYYAWLGDDGDRALQLVEEGLSMAHDTGVHVVDTFLALMGAYAAVNKGDDGVVVRYIDKFEATLQPGRRYAVFYHDILADRFLLTGRHSEALAHAMKMLTLSEESGHPFPEAWARTALSQAAFETGDIIRAENELSTCEEFYRQVGSPFFVFATCLLKAYYLFRGGKEEEASERLREALEMGRQNGYTYSNIVFRFQVWSLLCAKALSSGIEVEYVGEIIRKRRLSPPSPTSEYEEWPWPVKIYTFGRFEVFVDGKRLEFSGKAPRRMLLLLKSLVACGVCGASEEKLIDILWPDSDGDAAHDSFSVALHRLRQILGNERAILMRDGCPRLDPSICWVDAHAFEELLQRAEAADAVEGERLTNKALTLYKGQFLEGNEDPWLIPCRERLRNRFLRVAWRLGENLEETGRIDLALELYRRGIEVDPLAEELYRRIMRCHYKAGQKSEAMSVYERCKKILRAVLGISPSRETESLYRTLSE